MLATIVLSASLAVVVLKLLDFFMSESQKAALSEAALKLWNFLDDATRIHLSQWLRYRWLIRTCIAAAVFISAAYMLLVVVTQAEWDWSTAVLLIPFILALFLGIGILRSAMKAVRTFDMIVQAAWLIGLTIIPASAGVIIMFYIWPNPAWLFPSASLIDNLVNFFCLLLFIFSITLLPFFVVLSLPVILIGAASLLLLSGEFVMRRIAEYPKGPILAASTLSAAIAGAVKVFSS